MSTSLAELHAGPYKLGNGSQIRLLKILPGQADTPVQAELQVCDIQSKLRYEALSYVWGNHSTQGPQLYVNGVAVPEAHESLRRFLVRVRSSHKVRTVWADALCINQKDEEEKASQVPLMGQIYQNAKRVLCWLGEHDAASMKVFGTTVMDHLTRLGPLALPLVPVMIGDSIYRHSKMLLDDSYLEAWNTVLDRPYFNRTWIIQEVLLAREIKFLCGGDTMDMRLFTKPLGYYRRLGGREKLFEYLPRSYLLYFARQPSGRGRGKQHFYFGERDIFDLVYEFQHTNCSKQLDRVYALLALQAPSERPQPLPNYDINIIQLFVSICAFQLPRKVCDETCQKVMKLFKGLRLDKNERDEYDNHSENNNALAIINTLQANHEDLTIQSTVIRAFDICGVLHPGRNYPITTSDDPRQIQSDYKSWSQGMRLPPFPPSQESPFQTLMPPMWGPTDEYQKTTILPSSQHMSHNAAHHQHHTMHNHALHHQHLMQNQMLQNQMLQNQMMQNQMLQTTMMSNTAMMSSV